jgi:transcriptional regulator with XRE-family HTH domain
MQYHTLGTLIRLHRENLEMSRAELSRHIGVHPSQLTRWEAGDHKPSLTAMLALGKALDVDPVELMTAAAVDAR